MRSSARLSFIVLAAAGLVAGAQEPTPAAPPVEAPSSVAPDVAEDGEEGPERKGRGRDPVVVALGLPQAAQAARQSGLSEDEVRATLRAVREAGVGAAEATELLRRTSKLAREHGPVEGFADLVKSELASGKRGRDLAMALKAAHAARGRGPRGGPPPESTPAEPGAPAAPAGTTPDAAPGQAGGAP
jgi:hypothetical protein